ncbi:HlyD family efflux transporter periplasmic adaptor subunit [Bacteroides pyogenes]|uniref:HlyD family efflux transporter periplasmic adaptor subunit n=1 Tax=Bacteroides pyogenes TaxID=310300 RepID=A0A5D3E8A4_9BACE|nr:HlyD family efflux transporter periplasmic adaptor subunit [Bacteroides pyogenes]TYK32343.1 HlyD family efflux transporter periplasmic adaptor subunit [Bacteroides pyogenes]TYK45518.1 HlyD family efflux transporter periplasmic adaptor subunit [Bacteroides pyogenes]
MTNNGYSKNGQDEISRKSEEVQAIIDRMPTYWVKWVALCVGILMGVIVLLGFLIQYPDTVDGQISVTATTAPVRLVANSNGRINLLQANKAQLQKGDVIAYLESGANYKHILWVENMLNALNENVSSKKISLPDTLILGEVSSAYNAFLLAYLQYERVLTSSIYGTMRQNLQQQIRSDEAVIANLDNEMQLKKQILRTSANQLRKDSLLLAAKGISEQEYQRQRNAHLSLQEALLNLQSNRLMKQSEVSRNQLEIQRILLEETETKEKAYSDFITRKNELSNGINLWKERYLQYAPVAGELEFLGFWRDNSFVQAGQELFSVIPDKNNILGEVMIPSFGAGKIETGQTANVKINNYPYDEYGLMKGVVKSVSRITNKLKMQNGDVDAYLVLISFPKGTVTNFGKTLPLDFESKGTAEIITKRKRLIERLFDNLKAKREK